MLPAIAARAGSRLLAVLRRVTGSTPQKELSPSQLLLLRALLHGGTLKSHRYLDGEKEYRLHPLTGEATQAHAPDVRRLEDLGLLHSNHKFPATTLSLSQRGRRVAATDRASDVLPPSTRTKASTPS